MVGWSQGEKSRIRGELNTLLKEQSEHDDDEQPQFTLQLQDEDDGTAWGGRDSDMKWTGMLVVSLRGVNFGFWSRLGCSGQNVIIFSRQGLV